MRESMAFCFPDGPDNLVEARAALSEIDPWSTLEVSRCGTESRPTVCRSVAPLRLVSSRVSGPASHVRVSHYGGGMVDGDRVALKVTCRKGSKLMMSSVGNLQVYRSNVIGSSQRIVGEVAEGALAVMAQDPVVLHAGSIYGHSQEWHVHSHAGLVVAELMTGGRIENGERFLFQEYSGQFLVLVDEKPVFRDSFRFVPEFNDYRDPATFAGRFYMLSVYLIGTMWRHLADLLTDESIRLRSLPGATVLGSLYPLDRFGYVMRAVSNTMGELDGIMDLIHVLLKDKTFLGFNPRERKY